MNRRGLLATAIILIIIMLLMRVMFSG